MDCFADLTCSNAMAAGVAILGAFFNCLTALGALAALFITARIGSDTIKAAKETAKYTNEAAKAAAASVKETRLAAQSQIVSALLDTYANNDMLGDIHRLEAWKNNHPND